MFTVALEAGVAYHGTPVFVVLLARTIVLTFVLARLRAVRPWGVVGVAAMFLLGDVLFVTLPSPWMWPGYHVPILTVGHAFLRMSTLPAVCGQIVLPLLLLAGLDPELRNQLRAFVTRGRKAFPLRAGVAAGLSACALWSAHNLVNTNAFVQVRYEVAAVPGRECVTVGQGPSIAALTPAITAPDAAPATPAGISTPFATTEPFGPDDQAVYRVRGPGYSVAVKLWLVKSDDGASTSANVEMYEESGSFAYNATQFMLVVNECALFSAQAPTTPNGGAFLGAGRLLSGQAVEGTLSFPADGHGGYVEWEWAPPTPSSASAAAIDPMWLVSN